MKFQDIFFDSVVAKAEKAYKNFYNKITGILTSAQADTPISVSLAWQAFSTDKFAVYSFPVESPPKLFGLKLSLHHPTSTAHSGWIASAVIQKLVKLYGDFNSTKTWVGIKQHEAYYTLEQFSLAKVNTPVAFFLAVGEYAEECLREIALAEHLFNPAKFDEDGYYV